MSSKKIKQPSPELIAKYLAGECSPDEKAEVLQWSEASQENSDQLAKWQTAWLDASRRKEHEQPPLDADKAWNNVRSKKAKLDSQNRSWSIIWKVAASIVLILTVGIILRFYLSGPDMTSTSVTEMTAIELHDGTVVTLGSDGQLTYPEKFSGNDRKVSLSGNAYFDVTENPEKPFIITAGAVEIRVLGTSFDVVTSEDRIDVAVRSGMVQVTYLGLHESLNKGEKATVYLDRNEIDKTKTSSIGMDAFWRTQKLTFSGQTLQEVIQTLESTYNTKISLSNNKAGNCRVTAVFEKEKIKTILEVIAMSQNLSLEVVGSGYVLTGEGCATIE